MINTEESEFQIRIARMNERDLDIKSTKKVLIHVFFSTRQRGLSLALDDGLPSPPISYKDNIIDIQLKIVDDGSKPFKNPFPCVCTLEVGSDDLENIDDALKFNDSTHNVMLVTVNGIPIGTKPTGTRRKAVIYEDTDIIDSTDSSPI